MEPRGITCCFSVGFLKPPTDCHPWSKRNVFELALPHIKPTATTWSEREEGEHIRLGGRRAVAAASFLRDAWLGGEARIAQAPLPWLRGAAFVTRVPVAEFMPRPNGTALGPRYPFAELGPWPRGMSHKARAPFVGIVPWLRGTALVTRLCFAGAAP